MKQFLKFEHHLTFKKRLLLWGTLVLCEVLCLSHFAFAQADPLAQGAINDLQSGSNQTQAAPNSAAQVALDDSASKNKQSAQLHALPAAVCAAACGSGSVSGKSCSMASVAASLGTMAIEKSFQNNMGQNLATVQSLQKLNESDQETEKQFAEGVFRRSETARTKAEQLYETDFKPNGGTPNNSAQTANQTTPSADPGSATPPANNGSSISLNYNTKSSEGASVQPGQTNTQTSAVNAKDASVAKGKKPADANASKQGAPGKKKKRNMDACLAAAVATGSALAKNNAAQAAEEQSEVIQGELNALDIEEQELKLAQEGSPENKKYGVVLGADQSQSAAAIAGADPCAGIDRKSNPDAYVNCVQGFDPSVPDVLKTDQFKNDFKDLTGMKLGDFLDQLPPQASAQDVMSGLLGDNPKARMGSVAEIKAKLDSAAQAMNQNNLNSPGSTYAGGGSRSGGGSGDDEFADQMSGMMNGLMNQMGLGKKPQKQLSGVSETQFNSSSNSNRWTRQPSSETTIFEQITSRYLQVRHRLSRLPWSSKINQRAPQQNPSN